MRVPRQRSWLLLPISFLWILESAVNVVSGQDCPQNRQMSPQLGLLGSSVELSCVYPKSRAFTLPKITVYWQTEEEEEEVVHEFAAGQDIYTNQNKRYMNRTQLLRGENERNFSLRLSNLMLRDSKSYKCVMLLGTPPVACVHQTCVALKVAARFTQPVLSGPAGVDFGKAVVLSCSSSNGYPVPKVFWIDNEDGRVIDPSLSKNIREIDPETQLHSVRSQLIVNATENRSISCLVENAMLRENLTSNHYNIQVRSDSNHQEKQISTTTQATVGVVVLVLLVGVFVAGWLCKKSFCERYKGVPVAEAERQPQTVEQRASLNGSTLLQPEDGELQSRTRVNIYEPGSCGDVVEA